MQADLHEDDWLLAKEIRGPCELESVTADLPGDKWVGVHLTSASSWDRKADLRGRKQGDEEEEGPSRGAVRWAQGKSRLYESLMGPQRVHSLWTEKRKGGQRHFHKMSPVCLHRINSQNTLILKIELSGYV